MFWKKKLKQLKKKFGNFDLDHELTDHELDNFDKFMAITNQENDASEVNLAEDYEGIREHLP